MKTKALAALITISSVLPLSLSAQQHDHQAATEGGMQHCQMMTDMTGMQTEMQAMMKDMKDPAMKERMQKMHDQMQAMMTHMQDMHKGGEMAMQCGQGGGGMNMDMKGMNHEGMNMNQSPAPANPPAEHNHTP